MEKRSKMMHEASQGSGWLRLSLGLLVLMLSGSFAMAQLTQGTISGVVQDETGAVLPGVEVTLTHLGTGHARSTVSDEEGRYRAPSLPLGEYEIRGSLPGFQTIVRSGIQLTVGRRAVVDLVLSVGEVTQFITVSGEASLLETSTATVSNLVTEQKVRDLPLGSRDLTQLAFLQPGVNQIPQDDRETFSGMGAKISVAGSRGTQNLYLLDGVSNSDLSGNAQGASSSYIGAETVKEFQIITNNYSAEYRALAGAIISAVTKSGSNSFHGSLFEYHRNDNMDAANFFDNSKGEPKPEFIFNQFGGSIGGPIVPDQTFFFSSYEGLRERLGITDTADVPMRVASDPNTVIFTDLDDPTKTTTQTAIPSVQPFLNLWPIPGQGNTFVEDEGNGVAEISGLQSIPTDSDYFLVKIDHQFAGDKAGSLSGTYNYDQAERSPFDLLGEFGAQGTDSRKHIVSLRHTSVLSPTTINEFAFGYSLTEPRGDIPLSTFDFKGKGLLFHPDRELMGQLDTDDADNIGYRTSGSAYEQKGLSFKEAVSTSRGSHGLKMGVQINRYRYNQFSCSRGCNGIYEFKGLDDFLDAKPDRFQAFLPEGDNPERNLNQLFFGAYIQDDYQVRPGLTLNLGLRYEMATVPDEINGRVSNLRNFFDDEPTTGIFMTNPTLKSFSPRIGFAWAPGDQKTSVRAGIGIFYEHFNWYLIRTTLQEMPPFTASARVENDDLEDDFGVSLRFPDAYGTDGDQLLLGEPRLNIRFMDLDQRTTYMYRWSLNLQRELGSDWVVSAGYTGATARHLWVQNISNIRKWKGWPENPTGPKVWEFTALDENGDVVPPDEVPTCGCVDDVDDTAKRVNDNFGEMRTQSPLGNAFFHGLALGAQKRLSQGLQVQMSYNFSKAIDDGSGVTSGGDGLPENSRGIYFWDMHLKRGLSAFDIRNSFSANFTYEVPTADLSGVGGALVNGWQINGIVSISDGTPVSIRDSSDLQNDIIGDNEYLRVNLIPGGDNNPVLGGPDQYYDPNQFELSTLGRFGNLGKTTLITPGIATFDFSLFKNFDVTEGSRFQFRGEFFNLFNRANFQTPDVTPFKSSGKRDSDAGEIENTRTKARTIQLALKFIF